LKNLIFLLFFFPFFAVGNNNFSPKGITAAWDSSDTGGIQDGAGDWNSSSARFTYETGASNSPFCQGCNVSFGGGGAAGTITTTGIQRINSFTSEATTGNYTISGGTLSCVDNSACLYNINQNITIGSVIDGTMGIVKNGSQTLTLSGANTYSGSTTITDGILEIQNVGTYTGGITVNAGTTLNLQDSLVTGAIVNNATMVMNRTLGGIGNKRVIAGNSVSGTGTINVEGIANTPGTVDGAWITFNGNDGSYSGSGPVNINTGNLLRDNTLPNTINCTSDFTLAAGAGFGAGRGGNSTIGGLFGTGDVGTFWSGNGTITVGNGDKNGDFDGVIRGNGSGGDGINSGTLNVTKVGTGKQRLDGVNTYVGNTSINAGALGGDGSSAGSALTVAAGATIFAGGAGNSSTYTVGSLTLSDVTSTVEVYSDGVNISKIKSNGNCTMNGTIDVMETIPSGNQIVIECANEPSGTTPVLGTITPPQTLDFFKSLKSYVIGTKGTLDDVGFIYPTGAYSLVRLFASYAGNAIQVRRSSDNALQEIGFLANGDLDVASLVAFVGGNSGFVSIWYDQSGHDGRNAVQTVNTRQPMIINAGVLNTSSRAGIPSINFDGTRWLDTQTNVQTMTNAGADGTVFTIMNVTNSNQINFGVAPSDDRWSGSINWGTGILFFDPGNVDDSRVYKNNSANAGNWIRYTLLRSSTESIIRWSGAHRQSASASVATTSTLFFLIGKGNGSSNKMIGNMSEFVMYDFGVTGGNQSIFEQAQLDYWGVP